jgi:AP2-associated kinase
MLKGFTDLLYGTERYVISGREITVGDQIAEGGYAYIYRCHDSATNEQFALKKIICQSQETLAMANQEVQVLSSLPVNENIIRFFGSSLVYEGKTAIILILMELCTEGTLINLLEKYQGKLSLSQVLHVFTEVCRGVQVVHDVGYVHLDIKVENVLLHNKRFKLCDFGSCSLPIDLQRASRQELLTYEELFERRTTLMYRPPEMINIYSRDNIGLRADVWMLGCVLYVLAYFRHPFQDQNQLAIVNSKFNFPDDPRFDEKFKGFIKWIMRPKPSDRPGVAEILRAIQNYHYITQFYQEEDKPIRTKKIDRDLSEDEIQREMQRVREEMNKKRLSSSRPIEQVASTSIASASTPSNVNSIWSIPGISEHTPKSTASQPNIWGAVQSSSQSSTNNSGWAAF